jgi:hypothetical protein
LTPGTPPAPCCRLQIIQNALRVPMKTIASNAGVEGAVIVGKVRLGGLAGGGAAVFPSFGCCWKGLV